MHADLRVLDADAHVIEPADVFGADPLESMDLPETTPRVPCGDFELLADQFEHGFDAASYLRAMDRQGIDAAVLYPSMGLFVPFQPHHDATASASACAAYNDWIASYCAQDQARLAGVGIVPLIDPSPPPPRKRAERAISDSSASWCGRTTCMAATWATVPSTSSTRCSKRPGWSSRCTKGWGCAADDRLGSLRRLRAPSRALAPDGADGRAGEPLPRGRARTAPGPRGGVPRIGNRVAPVLARAARRPLRVDPRDRVRRPHTPPVGVLRRASA